MGVPLGCRCFVTVCQLDSLLSEDSELEVIVPRNSTRGIFGQRREKLCRRLEDDARLLVVICAAFSRRLLFDLLSSDLEYSDFSSEVSEIKPAGGLTGCRRSLCRGDGERACRERSLDLDLPGLLDGIVTRTPGRRSVSRYSCCPRCSGVRFTRGEACSVSEAESSDFSLGV